MTLNVEVEVAAMRQMTVEQLRLKYADVFDAPTRSRHKEFLIKRIAWRMQANAEGGISERARQRAAELANEADLRVTQPSAPKDAAVMLRLPPANGTPRPDDELKREYKDELHIVRVRKNGFEYKDEVYRSLSAVAKAITGTHWNGYHFFGLRKKGGAK